MREIALESIGAEISGIELLEKFDSRLMRLLDVCELAISSTFFTLGFL